MRQEAFVVAGNFDAETLWRDEELCQLPFIPDKASILITSALDELLFLLCKQGDVLLTNKAFDESLLNYVHQLGFSFYCNREDLAKDSNSRGQSDVLKNLLEYTGEIKGVPHEGLLDKTFQTFAVTKHSKAWCKKEGINYNYPELPVIKTVNSKRYSYELRKSFDIDIGSRLAESTEELIAFGTAMLKEGNPVILKDMFGVSGKGNLLVNGEGILNRLVKYIKKQEEKGMKVEFLLEPFLQKEIDFTCIAFIEQDGTFRVLDIQYMQASGFAYSGTCELTKELKEKIFASNYIPIVERACKELYKAGYHGDVCIDSMLLPGGEFVPIVEINARKSMTYMKYCLDAYLRQFHQRAKFTYAPFHAPYGYTVENLLIMLEGEKLLYKPENGAGIMPLSANTLCLKKEMAEDKGKNLKSKGRLYYGIIGETMAEIEGISSKVNLLLAKYANNL
ncbi:phosphoribosylglycinamide formyltransferase 2 [Anaerocolumna cellulosilytica]|uniref:Phosphoribosylglycinamide formyltransferase 2 n=1 Tax=Anaerocolumna cellulosilytica TaxID=433286 RepID=A0A6S6R327_9FIRM|nr:hypothetical protein [Anaerocolumna cellulosilytica]MBB5195972.1 hypothetical protein [Anaerocolumna cellulosilytica]BCJ93730.1 phosphoribosylglycinamide formyltransferase 2 [Anaerocolumna cellulosilytica]